MAHRGPIAEYLADGRGQRYVEHILQLKVREAIQLCMKREGFDYVVELPQANEVDVDRSELSELEWTEQYGYGLVATHRVVSTQPASRNLQLTETLSDGELAAYNRALFGRTTDLASGEPAPDACVNIPAQDSELGDLLVQLDAFNSEYSNGMEDMNDVPEMVAAKDEWARCMRAEGYDFRDQSEAIRSVNGMLDAATSSLAAELSGLTEIEQRAITSGYEQLSSEPSMSLSEVEAVEIAIAKADLDCTERYVNVVFLPLRDALERDMVRNYDEQLSMLVRIAG